MEQLTSYKPQSRTSKLKLEQLCQLPLVLVGFSKGCVVLNQIIHELPNYFPEPHSQEMNSPTSVKVMRSEERIFLQQIKAIYWLDSGHSGEREAWVTAAPLLHSLAQLGAEVHVHVSPHQVCCPIRPWIGEEKREFVHQLRGMGVRVSDRLHFGDQPRSLSNHFRILNEF